jgi:hypothetical protein
MPDVRVATRTRRSAIGAIAPLVVACLAGGIAWTSGTRATATAAGAGSGGSQASSAAGARAPAKVGAATGQNDASSFGGALAAASAGSGATGAAGAGETEAALAAAAVLPNEVTATPIAASAGEVRSGTLVREGALGTRVFADSRHGFALASVRGGQYPATTADGGRTWRIDGPILHADAAQAPLVVQQAGLAGPRTLFAWGGPGGGQTIDVTADGGRHWSRAIVGEAVLAVVAAPRRRLVAVVQASGAGGATLTAAYASTDGGRHWLKEARLGAG